MTVRSKVDGRDVIFKDGQWVFEDTGEPAPPASEEKKEEPEGINKGLRPLQIGRIVHYVIDEQVGKEYDERPAIVVRSWSDECANLQVFTDCSNDMASFGEPRTQPKEVPPVVWRTSITHDAKEKVPGTWHWPDE